MDLVENETMSTKKFQQLEGITQNKDLTFEAWSSRLFVAEIRGSFQKLENLKINMLIQTFALQNWK